MKPGGQGQDRVARLLEAAAPGIRVTRLEPLPPSGQASVVFRAVCLEGDRPLSAVAKRVPASLAREAVAYEGPLLSKPGIAPRWLGAAWEGRASVWLLLEEGAPADEDGEPWEEAAVLLSRVHAIQWPFPRRALVGKDPSRPLHLDERWWRGEVRIAAQRLRALEAEGGLPRALGPVSPLASGVLDQISLRFRAAERAPSGFVHGDYRMGNLVRTPDGSLRAIDWAHWGSGPLVQDLASLSAGLDAAGRERVLAAYLGARAPGPPPVDVWRDALEAFRPLRLATGAGAIAAQLRMGGDRARLIETLTRRVRDLAAALRTEPRP